MNETPAVVSTLRQPSGPDPDDVMRAGVMCFMAFVYLIWRIVLSSKLKRAKKDVEEEQAELAKNPPAPAPAVPAPAPAPAAPAPQSAPAADPNALYFVDTFTSTLTVYQDHCIITAKKNAATLLISNNFFSGAKKFYYADLITVQFREAGKLTDGYIEFEYPGSRSGNNGGAYTSENAFTFASDKNEQMRGICDFIERRIREEKDARRAPAPAAPSAMDELRKLKELLDMGAITQDEFDQKKKQLLNL